MCRKRHIVHTTKKILPILSAYMTAALTSTQSYALTISPDVTVDQFNNFTADNVEGVILGTVFWICRLFGIVVLMWGIYSYMTAKRDGEADSMNAAIVKMVFGVILFGLSAIFKGLNLIA